VDEENKEQIVDWKLKD